MMCASCQQPLKAGESTPYEIDGASGPGITIHVHKWGCQLPAAHRPTPYPNERRS